MKSSIVLILLLIITLSLNAQDSSSNHSYALSFGIAENFRLDRFNMDIAVKKIIAENQLRLFLSPRVSSRDEEDKTEERTIETNSFFYSIGIGADYLWLLIKKDDVNMFGGTGLVFTYGNRNEEYNAVDENGNKEFGERNIPILNFGIRGTLGVEWKVSNNIGIHSEYLLTGLYEWEKLEVNSFPNNNTGTRISKRITLNAGVLFGVSIYL